jgi:CMP-N-acetylneuraminic acid synthetase
VNILGLIPARGGSKAIPRKNIISLAGKPLIAYTCLAALESQRLNRVLTNTDDEAIAQISRQYGVNVPFLRPDPLASDEAPILPVIQHTLKWLLDAESYLPDLVVLLQPTSPLRTSTHIDDALGLMEASEADTLVSVQEVPHHFSPGSLMQLDEQGFLQSYQRGEMILRRQEKPRFYARNGPAILAVRRDVLESGRLYGDKVLPYLMGRFESIDVDDIFDLTLVEALLYYRDFKK